MIAQNFYLYFSDSVDTGWRFDPHTSGQNLCFLKKRGHVDFRGRYILFCLDILANLIMSRSQTLGSQNAFYICSKIKNDILLMVCYESQLTWVPGCWGWSWFLCDVYMKNGSIFDWTVKSENGWKIFKYDLYSMIMIWWWESQNLLSTVLIWT